MLKLKNEEKAGTKPKYQKKNNRKLNWYKIGQKEIEYKSVLFVPITKGGKLLKEMKKREDEINKYSDERIKIVEEGGVRKTCWWLKAVSLSAYAVVQQIGVTYCTLHKMHQTYPMDESHHNACTYICLFIFIRPVVAGLFYKPG